MFRKSILLGLFLIASSNVTAQSNINAQSNLTPVISGSNPEYPSYLATDSSGNLISTGTFTANMSASNVALTNSGKNDVFFNKIQ